MNEVIIELFDEISTLYKYFNNQNYIFFGIFLISIVYIFSIEENKKIRDFFVGYTIVIFLVIWNPLCIWVLNKFINLGSMYRIYYMLPLSITIAYTSTKIIENNMKIKKFVSVLMICAIIIFLGNSIFNEYTVQDFSNFYKLPDETVEIAYIISGDEETDYKKAIVPYGMSSKIRQICANIQLVYSRIVYNNKDENGNASPVDSDDPSNYEPVQRLNSGDVKYIVNLCKKRNVNYVVFDKNTQLSDNMENFGYKLYAETQSYHIYRLEKNE